MYRQVQINAMPPHLRQSLLLSLLQQGSEGSEAKHNWPEVRADQARAHKLVPVPRLQRHVLVLDHAVQYKGGEQDVALRREDLGDVPLDLRALLAALVEAVEQEQRTARRHRLAQHQVRGLAVLEAEEGVDPVPRRRERVGLAEQPRLQQLHLDEDGNELGVGPVERVHDDLVEQRRLCTGGVRGA